MMSAGVYVSYALFSPEILQAACGSEGVKMGSRKSYFDVLPTVRDKVTKTGVHETQRLKRVESRTGRGIEPTTFLFVCCCCCCCFFLSFLLLPSTSLWGRLFRNVHPSLRYYSFRSLIHTSLFDLFFGGVFFFYWFFLTCTSCLPSSDLITSL